MKRMIFRAATVLCSSLLIFSTLFRPVFAASEYNVTISSYPQTITEGAYGVFTFTVTSATATVLEENSCTMVAVFSSQQSSPALEGSGTVNGAPVTIEYGSAGMAGLFFSSTSLPATFTLNLTHSNEVNPTPSTSVQVDLRFVCDYAQASSQTVNVSIVDPCYGKVCGCGDLPACQVTTETDPVSTEISSQTTEETAPEETLTTTETENISQNEAENEGDLNDSTTSGNSETAEKSWWDKLSPLTKTVIIASGAASIGGAAGGSLFFIRRHRLKKQKI